MHAFVLASGSGDPQPATTSYNGWLIAAVVILAVLAVSILVWLAVQQQFWRMAAFALASLTVMVLATYANLPFRQLTTTGRSDRAQQMCTEITGGNTAVNDPVWLNCLREVAHKP